MKLILSIESGSLAGRTFELEEGSLTLGRGEGCSVRFDPASERVMSKHHCVIERTGEGFAIRDNQSTNGTFHNGQRVESAILKDGDDLQFGRNGIKARVSVHPSAADTAEMIAGVQPFQPVSQETRISPQFPVFQPPAEPSPMQAIPPVPSVAPDYSFQQVPPVPGNSISFRNSLTGLGGDVMGRAVPQPEQKSPVGRIVGALIGSGILLVSFLLVLLITVASLGPVTAVVTTVVAFLPLFLYLTPFMLVDRYDPEPFWLIALAFSWGALVSVAFSFFANTIFGIGAFAVGGEALGDLLTAVVSAPIFEELSKGLGLVILLVAFRKYFDDILDGIVFGGVIALGFAAVENILYYGRALNAGGFVALFLIFILRGVLSPFAHASFTAMTGIGCGIARETHSTVAKLLFPIAGYIVAVLLHALWNGMAFAAGILIERLEITWLCEYVMLVGPLQGLCGFFLAYCVLQIPLFLGFLAFTLYVTRRQNRILTEMLALDVARGLIPQEHFEKATSVFRSLSWQLGGAFSGKFFARGRYLRSIGKLGLSYWHIQRATAAQGQTASFQQNPIFREEVIKWREKV